MQQQIDVKIMDRLDVVQNTGGRTGRTDGPGGRTDRAEGPGGRTEGNSNRQFNRQFNMPLTRSVDEMSFPGNLNICHGCPGNS